MAGATWRREQPFLRFDPLHQPVRVENSFIPVHGVGETTERCLWRSGITHWSDFDPSVVGERTGQRIARYIETGEQRLADGDAAFFAETFPTGEHWRLYETFRSGACYLDIETTGLDQVRHDVTVVTLHHAGETTTLVRGDDLHRARLRDVLADAALLVTFNGKQFDVPFLESAFDLELDHPHLDLRYPCGRLGLRGGLKSIEQTLGIDRGDDDLSGRDAVRLWHAYERHGDGAALERLISYNRDDTVNLADLAEIVASRLHETVFEAACTDRQTRLD